MSVPSPKVNPELPHGSYTRIARRLRPKVSPEHVRQVALGFRKSPRVERAIERYRQSLEAQNETAA